MSFEYEPKGWQKNAAFLVVGLADPENIDSGPGEYAFHEQMVFPCKTSKEMSERANALLRQGAHRVLIFQAWEDSDGHPIWVIFDEVSAPGTPVVEG